MTLLDPIMTQLGKLWQQVGRIPTIRWATVTQATPLLIQMDGDLDPLLFTPQTVVSGLRVGQRVVCVEQNRRVIVIGADRFGADIPWTPVTLNTGWVNYPDDPALACRINGVIYLRGRVTRQSGTNTAIATLPVMFRPANAALTWVGWTDNGTVRLALNPDGTFITHGTFHEVGVSILTAYPAHQPNV